MKTMKIKDSSEIAFTYVIGDATKYEKMFGEIATKIYQSIIDKKEHIQISDTRYMRNDCIKEFFYTKNIIKKEVEKEYDD